MTDANPPDVPPPPPPPPPPGAAPSTPGCGCSPQVIGGVLAVLVLLGIIGAFTGSNDDADGGDGEEARFAAFGVCKDFVKDRLKAPSTAEFPNFFEEDGEVIVTKTGNDYRVTSHVDSENSFGASLRSDFVCSVTSSDGENFRLEDLSIL